MKAHAGDRLVIKGHRIGEPTRDGEILEVRGKDGSPPFLVRWEDGHIGLVFPGPDAYVDPGRVALSRPVRRRHDSV